MPKRKASFSSHDGCRKRSSASHIGNQSTGTTSLLHYASGQLGPETLSVGGSNHEHLPDTSQPLDRNIIHIDQWQSLRNNRDEETRIFQALMRYSLSQNVEPNNASAVPVPYDVENTASLMGAVDQSTLSSGIELPRPETVRVPQMTYERYQALLRALGHVKGTAGPARTTGRLRNLPGNDLGPRSDRKTDFRPDQAEWSIDNMPEIIYTFEPPEGYYTTHMLKEPPLKPYTIYGEHLRDIPILPDRISPDPESWLYEYWCRLDPRIKYERDIAQRIRPDLRPNHAARFSQARLRFRKECYVISWGMKGKNFEDDRARLLKAAAKAGVDLTATNSTRGLTWGLIDPTQGEYGGRIPVSNKSRPKNTRDDGSTTQNVLPASESSDLLSQGPHQETHQHDFVAPPRIPVSPALVPRSVSHSGPALPDQNSLESDLPLIYQSSMPAQDGPMQPDNNHLYPARLPFEPTMLQFMAANPCFDFQTDPQLDPLLDLQLDPSLSYQSLTSTLEDPARFYSDPDPAHNLSASDQFHIEQQPLDLPFDLFPDAGTAALQSPPPLLYPNSGYNIPAVFEGYAWENEDYFLDASGIYIPHALPDNTAPADPPTGYCSY